MRVFSVDAETDGLYGLVWAIGAVVLDGEQVVAKYEAQIDPWAVTDPWVQKHIVPVVNLPWVRSRRELLNGFWEFWLEHRADADCVADFGAPVEAALFRACIELDLDNRMWSGPYPMHELGTALLMAGLDPDLDRRAMSGRIGLVRHDPVDDAIAAGLCWQTVQRSKTQSWPARIRHALTRLLCRPGTRERLTQIMGQLDRMENTMATQDELNALAGRVDAVKGAVDTGVAGIRSDIDALATANPDLDLSALTASVAALETSVQGVTELDAENPAAPTSPGEPEVPAQPAEPVQTDETTNFS